MALSMNVVVWNSAIAGGGLLGGVLLGQWGAGSFPVLLMLLLLSLLIALRAGAHGFARAAGWTGNMFWLGDLIKTRNMDVKLLADAGVNSIIL